ncbi:mitochondrial 39-S ribosomal protein L47 (MRP-L47)-domain-containing protein [Powellomyces hirtus]|nr:mitochondrial 39-S ribosomal protein L47 (MRP-L47)-domain-containing protein [Powellomyces hirtus]
MAARPLTVLHRCFSSTVRTALSAAPSARPALSVATAPGRSTVGLRRGLEDFFETTDKGWSWTDSEVPTGRAWLAAELRTKSFEDMHQLWWVCIKEQNKLYSQKEEARRFGLYFPHKERLHEVKLTMKRLKQVLWERRISWFRAQAVLKREQKAAALRKEGLSESAVAAKMAELFPTPVEDIGRKPSKVKDEAMNKVKRDGETKGRTPRRRKSDKSSWHIV